MFTLATSLLALSAVASAKKSLSVTASAPASLLDVSNLEVLTTVTNDGDETLKLIKAPQTVLSPWATESFKIVNAAGATPEFTGVMVRFVTSDVAARSTQASMFTVLAPGESLSVSHEVGNFYNFTSAGAGSFTVTPIGTFQAVNEDGSISTIDATTTSVSVKLSGKLASNKALSAKSLGGSSPLAPASINGLSKRATYTSTCTSSYQSLTNAAITAGANYASRSVSHLTANTAGSTTQTTWYGTFSSSRYSVTLASFRTLVSAPAGWRYDCSCTDSGTYAYVYPSQYGTVYLCGYFWQAPATGAGSRADTIIHEGTHFPQVLGTDDWAYGQSACRSLAISNPTRAVDNADNHAFFSAAV